jgi:hypothetical protein
VVTRVVSAMASCGQPCASTTCASASRSGISELLIVFALIRRGAAVEATGQEHLPHADRRRDGDARARASGRGPSARRGGARGSAPHRRRSVRLLGAHPAPAWPSSRPGRARGDRARPRGAGGGSPQPEPVDGGRRVLPRRGSARGRRPSRLSRAPARRR